MFLFNSRKFLNVYCSVIGQNLNVEIKVEMLANTLLFVGLQTSLNPVVYIYSFRHVGLCYLSTREIIGIYLLLGNERLILSYGQ